MGTESPTLPPIPDLPTVAEVIRLAEAAEVERLEQRPPEWPVYRLDDLDRAIEPTPAWDELLAYLRGLPDEAVAGLYTLHRLGDPPAPGPAEAMERLRHSYELAMEPMHREHGAYELAAKGPLAHGLRRGIRHLGLELEPDHRIRDDDTTTP